MNRTVRLLANAALAAAFALVLVLAQLGPARAESNGGVRVMPLGDSITDGYTVPGGYRIGLWQDLVSGGYRVDFVGSLHNGPATLGDHDHEGHSGWTINQIDTYIAGWLTAAKPRTVLLHIGTNDLLRGNLSSAPSWLSMLIDHIASVAPNAEIFVATLIPIASDDSDVRYFNSIVPEIVQSKVSAGEHVHMVDMHAVVSIADLADGVHPNATGYQKMADAWYRALRSVPGSLSG